MLAFQQMLAHGLVYFKNKNKSMASLGSDAKAWEMAVIYRPLVEVSGLLEVLGENVEDATKEGKNQTPAN